MNRIAAIIVMLFYCAGLQAATYYLDASGGDDEGAGSVGDPWQTLEKAIETVTDGDTVIMAAGDYVDFEDFNDLLGDPGHEDWITYQAAEGADVNITGCYIGHNMAEAKYDAYYRFEGITFRPDAPKYHGAKLQKSDYIVFDHCTFLADGYMSKGDSGSGIYIEYSCDNITVSDCNFCGEEDAFEGGWYYGINVHTTVGDIPNDLTVSGCTFQRCAIGVIAAGNDLLLENNVMYNMDSDGIIIDKPCVGVTIQDNYIHDVFSPIWWTWTGQAYYVESTRTLTVDAGEGTPLLEDMNDTANSTDLICTWPTGSDITYQYQKAYSNTTTTITWDEGYGLGDDIGDVNNPVEFTIDLDRQYHEDAIQMYNEPGQTEDVMIRRNHIHSIGRQGIFLNTSTTPPSGGWKNVTIENNLMYTDSGNDEMLRISPGQGIVIQHNTMIGHIYKVEWSYETPTIRNNIIGKMWQPNHDEDGPGEDYNIYVDLMGQNDDSLWGLGEHSVLIENSYSDYLNHPDFAALFSDYEAMDFNLPADSNAVDFCNETVLSTDFYGNSRVDIAGVDNSVATEGIYGDAGAIERQDSEGGTSIPVIQHQYRRRR